jgi:hypothetical protein
MRFGRAEQFRAGIAVLLLLAGCGGSGSSGFDGAIKTEPQAIERAKSEGICVEFKSTIYCGPGAPVTIGDDSAVVDFAEASDPLPCPQLPGDPGCTATVGFDPSGFPETAVFLGAWAESERGPWTLSDVDQSAPGSGGEDEDDDVVVVLPDAGGGEPSPLLIGVLVYLSGALPSDSPAVALRLRAFKPDIVYVSAEVEVSPSSSGEPGGALR